MQLHTFAVMCDLVFAQLLIFIWPMGMCTEGIWRCCLALSRTWTSIVQLETPCRPSLLTSDTAAGIHWGWSWTSLFLLCDGHSGFFLHLCNLHNLSVWLMCLLLQHLYHTHIHLSNSVVCCLFFWDLKEPEHNIWISVLIFESHMAWNPDSNSSLHRGKFKHSCHFGFLSVIIFSAVSVCWYVVQQ